MTETNIVTKNKNNEQVKISRRYPILRKAARTALVYFTSLCIVLGTAALGVMMAYNAFLRPVDENDNTPIKVVIERGSSLSKIAKTLHENNIIRNRGAFKLLVDFSDQASKLQAGEYELTKSMTISQIIEKLSQGDGKADVIKFTITEGKSVEEIAKALVQQKVLKDEKRFLELCKTGEQFLNYDFIGALDKPEDKNRKYMLEGYLFPDTYEVYTDSSEETVIRKMLDNFDRVFSDQYMERANQLNMTMDQVVTLASMIEKEGNTQYFNKISAVFHNRLKKNLRLQSCVTVQYAIGVKRLALTEKDTSTDSPYNTYKVDGLPLGPVSNPGRKAIEAALYPDEEFMKEGFYYFASTDKIGELVFSKTAAEHNAIVEKYRPAWIAYDEKNGNR